MFFKRMGLKPVSKVFSAWKKVIDFFSLYKSEMSQKSIHLNINIGGFLFCLPF